MNEWYYTADQHFDHPFMCSHRGFSSVARMDKILIEAWNDTVKASGIIVICGDFFWSKNPYYVEKILKRLKGNKIFVKGNHDYWVKKLKYPFRRIYQKNLKFGNGNNQYIVCCHYPMASWNRKMYGAWQIHGHTHGNYPPLPNQIDVSVDNAKTMLGEWRPFTHAEIKYLLTTKEK